MGLGTRVIDAICEHVKDRGGQAVRLGVDRGNVRARALYERTGFHFIYERERAYASGFKSIIDVLEVKTGLRRLSWPVVPIALKAPSGHAGKQSNFSRRTAQAIRRLRAMQAYRIRRLLPPLVLVKPSHSTGFIVGNAITSRIEGLSVISIASRSKPMPSPPMGGMPNASA